MDAPRRDAQPVDLGGRNPRRGRRRLRLIKGDGMSFQGCTKASARTSARRPVLASAMLVFASACADVGDAEAPELEDLEELASISAAATEPWTPCASEWQRCS